MTDDKTPDTPEPPEIPVEVEGEATAPAEAADLAGRITQLEQEKKDTYDRLLRTAADFENFRKRARKDVDDARYKAYEDVLRGMLPVLDNLERALAAGSGAGQAIVDGVKLVLRQAASSLEKFEVKTFAAVGQPFDPARHEAIAQVESADQPAGTVVSEMQKGYTMGPRLLRPALVAVAKAPPAPSPPTDDAPERELEQGDRTDPGAPAGPTEGE